MSHALTELFRITHAQRSRSTIKKLGLLHKFLISAPFPGGQIEYDTEMMKLSCHCGRVRIQTSKRPDFVNECNCTLCRKTGAQWAYYHPSDVGIAGATKGYRRGDKETPFAEVQFCQNCGSTTHFILTESAVSKFGNVQLGVNVRLAAAEDLVGIELRYPDGQAWSGKGGFGYVQKAHIISR